MSSPNEIKINESQADLDEVKSLLEKSTREKVKELLKANVEKLEADLARLKRDEQIRLAKLNAAANGNTGAYTKKIDTYGWDQSEKFVKIYITSLGDTSKVKESDLITNFTETSFELTVNNFNNANHNLVVNNLLNKIDPQASYAKAKSDSIIVFLKKQEQGKNWNYVTGVEMKAKEKSMPKFEDKQDPQEGLMSLMKKMYEDGDDEMKRTIAKAFTESRDKSMKGGLGDMMGDAAGLDI